MSCCNYDEELLAMSDAMKDIADDLLDTATRGYYAHFIVRDDRGDIVDTDMMKLVAESHAEAIGKVYLAVAEEYPGEHVEVRVDEDFVLLLSTGEVASLLEGLDV